MSYHYYDWFNPYQYNPERMTPKTFISGATKPMSPPKNTHKQNQNKILTSPLNDTSSTIDSLETSSSHVSYTSNTISTSTQTPQESIGNKDYGDYTKYIKEDLWIPKVRWVDLEETWDLHIDVLEET